MVVQRGQIRRIGWVVKILEAQVGQFLLGCKCRWAGTLSCKNKTPLVKFPRRFSFKSLQLHQQRWVILCVDILAPWKIINVEIAILTPKNLNENFSSGLLHAEYFGAGWAAMLPLHWLLLCLRVIGFIHGHQSRQKIIWIASKNSTSCADDWHRWCFSSAFRHFETHFAESFLMPKTSWMMDPTRSREMPSCSAIHLAELQRYFNIISWIWSIISEVITVLGRPGRSASHVEKSARLTLATQFLTVAYNGACSPNVSIRMAWISCLAGKELDDTHVSMLLKSRTSPDMLPFSLCNKEMLAIRHMNRLHLSNDTTDSVLRHRKVGRAKDLPAPLLHTYIHTCIRTYIHKQ